MSWVYISLALGIMTKKAFFLSVFGLIVQYYDHHLFGLLAATLSRYFIPAHDHTIQLLNTYFIMAIAVIAKPIGAFVLGRIGDVYGRSATFTISLLGASAASLVISIIPGYQHIGVMSALILLLAKMGSVAVISSGTDGVRLFIYEQIGKERQCLGTGLAFSSTLIGTLIASLSAWFFTLETMPSYSWRFAFLLGSLMGLSMLMVRRHFKVGESDFVKEAPDYDSFKNQSTISIIKKNFKLFAIGMLVAGSISSTNHFYILFFGTYNFDVLHSLSRSTMQFYTSVGIALYIVFAIVGGLVADFFGRKLVAFIAFVVLIIITVAMMVTMSRGHMNPMLFFASMSVLPFFIMPTMALLKQSIPVAIRYRIFSLAHAVGSITIGTPTAFLSLLMYRKTGLSWLPVCYFFVTILIIGVGTHMLCKKYDADKY